MDDSQMNTLSSALLQGQGHSNPRKDFKRSYTGDGNWKDAWRASPQFLSSHPGYEPHTGMGGPGMSDFGHAQGNGMGGGINPMPPQSMPPLNSGGIMPPGMGSPVPMPPTQMGPPISLGGFPANPQSGPGGEMGHPPPMPTMPGMGGPRPMNPALGMGARKPTFPRI